MLPLNQFCSLCLSCDRNLSFSNGFVQIFSKYFKEIKIINPLENFCFECINMLRKMEQFRKKVMLAQKLMNLQNLGSLKDPIKSLSTLSCQFISYPDFPDNDVVPLSPESELTLKEELPVLKLEDINEETEDDSDFCPDSTNYADNMFDDDDEDIKCNIKINSKNNMEPITNIKLEEKVKKRKKSTKKYYDKIYKGPKSYYMRRTTFDKNMLKHVMDKDRNSIIYQSLQFKCSFENCIYGSDVEEKLNEHMQSHNSQYGKYQCNICGVWWKIKKKMEAHRRAHFTLVTCRICDAVTCDIDTIKQHIDSHQTRVECVHCKLQFDDAATCKVHTDELHSVFICDICGQRRNSKYRLATHINANHKKITCKLCGLVLKNNSKYKEHYRIRHIIQRDEQAFCTLCNKQYDNARLYKMHVMSTNAHAHEWKGGKKEFLCPVCGKKYKSGTYMQYHWLYAHKKQYLFQCKPCGKKFATNGKYKNHMKYTHEGKQRVKNKICNVCGRGFSMNKTLIHHLRTHTGERPFECDLCPSKFSQKSALKTHVKKIHDKVEPRNLY